MSEQADSLDSVGFRASPQQEHLLAGGAEPVVQCAAVLHPGFDRERLRVALGDVVARHEILRTTFVRPAAMRVPSQVVHDELAPEWRVQEADASALLGDRAAFAAVLAREARRPLDSEHGPPVRALLVGRDGERGLLVLGASAASADAESLLLILDELAARYSDRAPANEPIQYADYAAWRHEHAGDQGPVADEARAFWRAHADQAPADPRLLFGAVPTAAGAGESMPVELRAIDAASIQRAALDAAVSVPVYLEAAWHALLARLSGSTELQVAGWCDGGRGQPDLEGAVGPYAQPVPIRSALGDDSTFAELLDQLQRGRARAAGWQDYASAADLAAITGPAGIGFALTARRCPAEPFAEILAFSQPPASLRALLGVRLGEDRVEAELRYDAAAFDRRDAEQIAASFALVLADAVTDPSQPVARLGITDAGSRRAVLSSAAGPAPADQAATPAHHRFERCARLTPLAPAVADADDEVSYGDLNGAANRLAHFLRDRGVGPNAPVGLCMERTTALLEALLGILKAGGAYLPLNYDHPPARVAHQLAQADAKVLVTEAHLLDRLPEFEGEIVCVDRDRDRIDAFPAADPEHLVGPEDLAYLMYTSGSTGLPKGVAVTHGNLANYAAHMIERLAAGDDGRGLRCGVISAISTDLGNTCIFPPLIGGGCVALISPTASMDADAALAELGDRPLDVLKITPSHLRGLLESERAAELLPRRALVLGGEALSWELVDRVRALSPGCRIINHYGPTETTIGCCAYEVGARRPDCASVPIGRPLPGVSAYVLDQRLAPVPVGVAGELCIAGAGVAAGYVGHSEDSEPAFLADPFVPARMYRTGDRARWLRDGTIEFLGRVDNQVKVRGFRIEPGEIEAALARHPAIRQAAVTAEEAGGGEGRLVAHLVCGEDLTVEQLRAFLAQSLPDYMIPAAFATHGALPFTPSGKIDRRALQGLAASESRREAQYVAPRTPLEQTLSDIWVQLLGVKRVGIEDDFFALGGHSLLAARVVARVRTDLAVDLPLNSLFTHPTIATLTSEIVAMMGDSEAEGTASLIAELEGLSDEEAERLLNQAGPR